MCRCPAHDDRDPSLSICDADDGKVLVYCHAGCDQEKVITALRARGLWTQNGPRASFSRPRAYVAVKRQPDQDDTKRSEAALAIWQSAAPADGTLVESVFRIARPAPSAAANAPLPPQAEAPLRLHSAGNGRAGDARSR